MSKITMYKFALGAIVFFFILQLFLFLNFAWFSPIAQAQSNTLLSPQDEFHIPACNGIISFAANGTYSKATLQNNIWIFNDLRLTEDEIIRNFSVSVQNSNITINSFRLFNGTRQTLRFDYHIEGVGKQTFNFGLGPINGRFASTDWSVITRNNGKNVFLAEGRDFTLSQDGTLTVADLTGNVSIVRWGFSDSLSQNSSSFIEQNSVAITVAALLTIVVVVAVVIKVRTRSSSNPTFNESVQTGNRASDLKQLWGVPFW